MAAGTDLLDYLSNEIDSGVMVGAGGEEPVEDKTASAEGGTPPLSVKSAFSRRDIHPILLGVLLLDKYGPQWLGWEPETLWQEIESDFGATPGVHTRNKINALKTAHVVDSPWIAWEVFNAVVHAFTDNIPNFRVLHRPTPSQIVSAVTMMNRIKKSPFSDEVGRYIAACFLDDGVFFLPPPVGFAQPHAAMPRYRCRHCGNIDSDDSNEVCDSCGAPASMLEKYLGHDPESVSKRYAQVMKDGDERDYYLVENMVDVQVAKLVGADMINKTYEQKLKDQSGALKHG